MSKKTIYLLANWKMYLDYEESNALAKALVKESKKFNPNIKMAVFPSALSFCSVSEILEDSGIGAGAQNVCWVEKGGYTGEISARMFKEVGANYSLIGHSERRHLFHETNHEVRQKMEDVLAADLTPVLCVGETLEERLNGKTEEIIEIQVRSALENLDWPNGRELIIAYEPVWAIGTGESCDASEAERVGALIIKMAVKLLPNSNPILVYGGSVRAENVADYIGEPGISGVLVGSYSTKIGSWMEIVNKITE